MKKLLASFLAITLSLLVVGRVMAVESLVVSGDTAVGYDQPGWLFNRDLANDTPFVFNVDAASIGVGSLYVKPIGANGPDKMIAENFINTPVSDVNTIKYDFKIGAGGELADASQFYMNVYTNFGQSEDLKYYDCKYDVVPTVGSMDGFTSVTFDPTQTYTVTKSGTSPFNCPATPAGMEAVSAGSNIRAFSLNVGDTSTSDTGLDGYLDNVVTDLDSGVTTYDFEPVVTRAAAITAPTAGQEVSGSVLFTATLADNDVDEVEWAVREGKCNASGTTVFGNVGGNTDVAVIDSTDLLNQTFSFTGDMSSMNDGNYCFSYNPVEDASEANLRETVNFTLDSEDEEEVGDVPTMKEDCKQGGWMTLSTSEGIAFKNQGQCVNYVNHTDGRGQDDEHAKQVKVVESEEVSLSLSSSLNLKSKKNR